MADLSFQSILACFYFLFMGTGGGWLITNKIAGRAAANDFFVAFIFWVLSLLLIQLSLWSISRKRLLYQIVYRATFSFAFMSFFLGLFFPIFWMPDVGRDVKISFAIFLALLSLWNIRGGVRHFKEKWSLKGDKLLSKNSKAGSPTIGWNKMMIALGVAQYGKLIAGLSDEYNGVLSIILMISMGVGLNLRNVFPEFSMFAWGVPSAIGAAYAMFIFGGNIGELLKVREIEVAKKIDIAPE